MECPAQSPDLNPIELVWDELDRRVKAKQNTSATIIHFWDVLYYGIFLYQCHKVEPFEHSTEDEGSNE